MIQWKKYFMGEIKILYSFKSNMYPDFKRTEIFKSWLAQLHFNSISLLKSGCAFYSMAFTSLLRCAGGPPAILPPSPDEQVEQYCSFCLSWCEVAGCRPPSHWEDC